ncbi:hypothetical protein [Bifidobacterium pseudolongum]|uniref:Uncharacterized protein n=1 Tax=Bifidobacterium pseudolongum subsp. globosum TaxID=1690 RepID=A0A4V1Y229_9BIFI|nr:hypothetical protein [Bifidobacterium pseudolongum]RYQ16991.1 hypothetical protein PG2071B_1568 [Bifidobacterium pseudolongum subsp. globosum]
MTAKTPHFEIPYPTTDDQIRLIPDQLKALATKVDTTMYGASVIHTTDLASIDTTDLQIGQQAYLTTSVLDEMAKAGTYYWYGRQWVRAAWDAMIFNLIANDSWELQTWQWQTNGQPYMYIRAVAKKNISVTDTNRTWNIATYAEDAYKPPAYCRFNAFTPSTHAADFGFTLSPDGLSIEAVRTGFTFNQYEILFAQMTWPCPSVGRMRYMTAK